jgi:hypothetical protein
VGVLKTINSLIDAAAERNDSLLHHLGFYSRGRWTRAEGRRDYQGDDRPESGLQRTRELFTECPPSGPGAFKRDMDVFTVSRGDLEYLVGE